MLAKKEISFLLAISQLVMSIFGDECTFDHNKLAGTCVLASKCPQAGIDFRSGIRPTLCSFARNEPIVCCAEHRNEELVAVRKSVEYCNLYGTPTPTLFETAIFESLPAENGAFPVKIQDSQLMTEMRKKRKTRASLLLSEFLGGLDDELNIVGGVRTKINEFAHMIQDSESMTAMRKKRKTQTSPLFSKFPIGGHYKVQVVGGIRTQINEFAHMAAIGWRSDDGETDWNCGGSLISLNFVLTAAHCSSHRGIPPNVIRIGGNNLRDAVSASEFGIASIVTYPDYTPKQHYNDIALMKLDKEIVISNQVRPACLWQTHAVNLTHSTVIGYGHTEYGGKVSPHLLKADLRVFDNSECFKDFPKSDNLKEGVISSQLCAGDPTGERDTCQGDSGGPLLTYILKGNQKIYHIIGITSFGRACATSIPAIYTRVSSYLDWIEGIVWP